MHERKDLALVPYHEARQLQSSEVRKDIRSSGQGQGSASPATAHARPFLLIVEVSNAPCRRLAYSRHFSDGGSRHEDGHALRNRIKLIDMKLHKLRAFDEAFARLVSRQGSDDLGALETDPGGNQKVSNMSVLLKADTICFDYNQRQNSRSARNAVNLLRRLQLT